MRVLKQLGSTESLLLCGVIGPPLFYIVLLLEGATRPGFNVIQTQGSYLALTNQGWEQIANFIVFGLLCIAFAVGLRRIWRTGRASIWGPLLIGLFGLGLIVIGVCVTDPGDGYPPGAPLNGSPQTWHGWVHGLGGAVIVNIVLPAACFVLSRRFAADPKSHRWATYSWMTGALLLVISIPATIALPFAYKAGFPVVDGLFQRVLITLGWLWLTLVALHLWREVLKARSEEVSTGIVGTSATVD